MRRWYSVRLWIVSFFLFGGGLVTRAVLERESVAYSYPFSVQLQFWLYIASLFLLFVWIIVQADTVSNQLIGCFGWLAMAAASAFAILMWIPK